MSDPLDASPEITAMVERAQRMAFFYSERPSVDEQQTTPSTQEISRRECLEIAVFLQETGALLRRLGEREAKMRCVVDAAIRLRDDATGSLGRYNELWDALDRAGKEGE